VKVRSKNFELKLEEITKEKIIEVTKNETEKRTLELICDWNKGKQTFDFQTSGSTGLAKSISIAKESILYSTDATFSFIDPLNEMRSTLLCINPNFIGGAMVVFRALIKELDLFITEPASNPLQSVPGEEKFDLVSLVPLQYESLELKAQERFHTILIGGAPITSAHPSSSKVRVFSTYGMTETVSHIALRKLSETQFHTTGDTKVSLSNQNCLQFKGVITDHKWLPTNDIGVIHSPTSFEWIGRKDFIINSGGVKVNPEKVEAQLTDQLDVPFLVSSKPDEMLNERVILIIQGKEREVALNYSDLPKYAKPKEVLFLEKLPMTPTNKIERKKIKKLLRKK